MSYRAYVERRPPFALEARALCTELRELLGIASLERVRILERYDVDGLDAEALGRCGQAVFADPHTDLLLDRLPEDGAHVLAVEPLPGQYDQRADATEKCIQLLLGDRRARPTVRTARIFLLYGPLSDADLSAIERHLVNPVECRLARLEEREALDAHPEPGDVPVLSGFRELDEPGLAGMIDRCGLAMSVDDLRVCQGHFTRVGRDPTLTEIRVLDTYWSDHCRHRTFHTSLGSVTFEDERVRATWERYLALREELGRADGPITLMDMATIGARALATRGELPGLVTSDEVNACTVRVPVRVDGREEPWLLLFKNETHNHPTEIEPFGGAATCIGGAIRDPLSGRGHVYQAMRVTGAADPRQPISETLHGKLPQRTIVTKAAAGYSSYGNQVGVPTGLVDEIYHPGYVAKRMEVGAVVAAVPEAWARREAPSPGDVVLLLGGRTGRDGCGGATGSSRSHDARSVVAHSAEVQKGNAPEERKLQRLFLRPDFTRLVKRCNDFGAGGVSVAVGELADGVDIDLDAVPLKYAGLDGTEIAISESQERMAIVVSEPDAPLALRLAEEEDVPAVAIARVTDEGRMRMTWRGMTIVDLPRDLIQSNGAARHADAIISPQGTWSSPLPSSFALGMRAVASDLNVCSKRGLAERFDSTVGARTVLMPFGGTRQRSPIQAMVAKIPVPHGETDDCSLMAWGFDPYVSSASPYDGAYWAVVESVCRLAATGARLDRCWLSFQEYFGRPGTDPRRWGWPVASLLGALAAQMDLGVAAIGGKDSMSGTFSIGDTVLDVPPTLISFAVSMGEARRVVSPELEREGSRVVLLRPRWDGPLPDASSLRALLRLVDDLMERGRVLACATPGFGGVAATVLKMCIGNGLGFAFAEELSLGDLFGPARGSFVMEMADGAEIDVPPGISLVELGRTQAHTLSLRGEAVTLDEIEAVYEGALEGLFPMSCDAGPLAELPPLGTLVPAPRPPIGAARPRFLIPVFPGTNCELETARAVERAGGEAEILVVRTTGPDAMMASTERFAERLDASQALLVPGGFSNGDEPDGSGKAIAIFLRGPAARAAVGRLLDERGGLVGGICNGFQALVRTGLIPFGRIVGPEEAGIMALTFNAIGRHQSKMVRVRVACDRSPWLRRTRAGEVYAVPISHGEGRFVCGPDTLDRLARNGQIATQYVGPDGRPTMDVQHAPNGSLAAIEGLTSPDGRVFGRMAHAERVGPGLYKNVGGASGMGMFESAIEFLRG